jgi:hypothetical protein
MLAKMNANMKYNEQRLEAKIDTNWGTVCEVLKEMHAKMKDTMESQICFLVSRMETEKQIRKK